MIRPTDLTFPPGTDFLNVCDVTRPDPHAGRFNGRVEAGHYSAYARSAPLVLLFEALHQFAVKAARQMHGRPALMVPAQLRNISVLAAGDPLAAFNIHGEVTRHGNAYRVSIQAQNDAGETLANGYVFISVLISGVQS
ncbi:hypothetical protein QS306_15655 [Paraburkholderia bonniea]|uniref:hypothetical protein n=1 Tax=Paraburkholderia bonniea TaxID=2152891 RepID=UPI001290A4C0|nr:hypothetical protein [Paraburkholderia bonniea]WJF91524.1 hypothetical protein QS306_15655 [Paraburkholderia bonniea]WJF94843.1 hypothetical protein QS308_15660 [Paraburkholderia bonniea]